MERSDKRMDSLKRSARFLPINLTPVDDEQAMQLDAAIKAKKPNKFGKRESYLDRTLDAASKQANEWFQVNRAWPDFVGADGVVRNQAVTVASSIRCGSNKLPGKWKGCGKGVFEPRCRYINEDERVVDVRKKS